MRASFDARSIPLITNHLCNWVTQASKYCTCFHFLSVLSSFCGSPSLIFFSHAADRGVLAGAVEPVRVSQVSCSRVFPLVVRFRVRFFELATDSSLSDLLSSLLESTPLSSPSGELDCWPPPDP